VPRFKQGGSATADGTTINILTHSTQKVCTRTEILTTISHPPPQHLPQLLFYVSPCTGLQLLRNEDAWIEPTTRMKRVVI